MLNNYAFIKTKIRDKYPVQVHYPFKNMIVCFLNNGKDR